MLRTMLGRSHIGRASARHSRHGQGLGDAEVAQGASRSSCIKCVVAIVESEQSIRSQYIYRLRARRRYTTKKHKNNANLHKNNTQKMSNPKIEKIVNLKTFKPDEYLIWKAQTEATFHVHGLLQLVKGEEQHPHPNADDTSMQTDDTDNDSELSEQIKR